MSDDLRVRKNRMAISSALFRLLERKTFESITVADLCAQAMVARSTFYQHYTDKYALLNSINRQRCGSLERFVTKRFHNTDQFPDLFNAVQQWYADNATELRILLHIHTRDADLRRDIEAMLSSRCEAFIAASCQPVVEPQLVAKLYAVNVLAILEWALEHGITDSAARTIAALQHGIMGAARQR